MGKLVRDRIPEIMRAAGKTPDTRILDQPEYLTSLLDKLVEEAEELRAAAPGHRPKEAADVYEVLTAITATIGTGMPDVERAAAVKAQERGRFDQRIWLEDW